MADDTAEERAFTEARAQYKRARVEYVPVRARNGKQVHATTLRSAPRTGCDKRIRGAVVATSPLTCVHCMIAVGLRVTVLVLRNKPKSKRGRKRKR